MEPIPIMCSYLAFCTQFSLLEIEDLFLVEDLSLRLRGQGHQTQGRTEDMPKIEQVRESTY